jgi:hypothetical protein
MISTPPSTRTAERFTTMTKLWIDDLRPPRPDWPDALCATTSTAAIALLREHGAAITDVSFDHDLGLTR